MKKDWEIKKLGELCSFIGDGDWIESGDQSTEGIRLVQTGNVGEGIYLDKENRAHYISEETFTRLKCTEIFPGDCLISRLPEPVGRACIIPDLNQKMITAVDCTIIRFKENIQPQYFVYYSQSNKYLSDIDSEATGATRKRISRKNLEKISIPVPPLEEQKRIVKILDEKFAQLETIKTNAQTNLQNAKDLFQSQLAKAFSNTTWEKKTIGDICLLKSGNSSSNNSKPGNLPYVKVGDMTINGNEKTITTSTLFVDYEENKKNIFPKGTVIFPKRGGAILTNKKRLTAVEICCDLNIMGVIPTDKILSEFLYYYFIGIDFAELCNGAAIPQINNIDINPLTIHLPPLPEQKRIVEELDALSEKVRQLQEIYTKQIANCDELKQSLLQKAFEGEL